jgi:hypothetical protein
MEILEVKAADGTRGVAPGSRPRVSGAPFLNIAAAARPGPDVQVWKPQISRGAKTA